MDFTLSIFWTGKLDEEKAGIWHGVAEIAGQKMLGSRLYSRQRISCGLSEPGESVPSFDAHTGTRSPTLALGRALTLRAQSRSRVRDVGRQIPAIRQSSRNIHSLAFRLLFWQTKRISSHPCLRVGRDRQLMQ